MVAMPETEHGCRDAGGRATQWIILRAAEERLRAIPLSVWKLIYNRLLAYSSDVLHRLAQGVTGQDLFNALNPERCTQQTLKVLMPYSEALTDQPIHPLSPVIWDNVPLMVRSPIYQRVAIRFKPCIDQIVASMQTILSELFNHQNFISSQVEKYETGYRFICTESLHQYWHSLHRKSRNLTLTLTLLYIGLSIIWRILYINIAFLIIPMMATLIASFFLPALTDKTKATFARCLGFWFGERIYLIDELVQSFTKAESSQPKIRAIISHALQPLIEDAPLRALAQISLGRRALIVLRPALVNFILQNGSTPFEHTQFKHERSLEVSEAFETHINTKSVAELNEILKPTLDTIRQILALVTLSLSVLLVLIFWYM